ncbi:MAG: SAV_915 family protein [Trebonia sp.]
MNHTLYVPVRVSDAGVLTLRTARLESGERTGLAFTSQDALSRTLGPDQRWVTLAEPSLSDMLAPLGIRQLRVDPLPLSLQVKTRIIPNDCGFLPPVPLPVAAG